jgi:hypothetical protein
MAPGSYRGGVRPTCALAIGLTRNRVLSSHRRQDTSTPRHSPRLARLQGVLYTRRNVARWASTPRGHMSQASPLVSTSSFPRFEPASPSLLPFGLPRPAYWQLALRGFPVWRTALGAPCGLIFCPPHPIVPTAFTVAPHAGWYWHFFHMLAHFYLDSSTSVCENSLGLEERWQTTTTAGIGCRRR